jgi:hypothetical protein
MQIDAYNTTVGKPYRIANKVEATIQALHVSRSLTPTKKENVFVVTHENKLPIDVFAFPITLQAYNRKIITIYDERPYRNQSNNQVTNSNELVIMRLAAFLQQDVAEGNMTPLKGMRNVAMKAFADSVGHLIINRGNLGSNSLAHRSSIVSDEALTLKILLSYYFIGLEEPVNSDLEFVTINVIRTVYGTDKGYVMGVIEGVGRLNTLDDLLKAIHNNPILYKLKGMTLKDFLTVLGGINYAALGKHIIGAACEAPCLFSAFAYGAVRFKAYAKTPMGMMLDPKYNERLLEGFVLKVDSTYDLNG